MHNQLHCRLHKTVTECLFHYKVHTANKPTVRILCSAGNGISETIPITMEKSTAWRPWQMLC